MALSHINGIPLPVPGVGEDACSIPPFFVGQTSYTSISPYNAINSPRTAIANERYIYQDGDILVIIASSTDQIISVPTPTGFQEAPNSPITNSTNTKLAVFWKRISYDEDDIRVLGGLGDQVGGTILIIRGAISTGDPWDDGQGTTGTAGKTLIVVPGLITNVDNTLIVNAAATSRAVDSTSTFSGWTNPDLIELFERTDYTDVDGGGFGVATGIKEFAGEFSDTYVTQATSEESASWAGALKPASVALPIIAAVGNANPGVGGAGGLELDLPDYREGDILVAFIESDAADTVTLPGYSVVPDSPIIQGSTQLSIFWKRATNSESNPITSAFSGDHQNGRMVSVRNCKETGSPWDDTAFNSGTGTSITINGISTTQNNCLVLSVAGTTRDATSSSTFSGWTNSSLDYCVEIFDSTNSTGTGGGMGIAAGLKPTSGIVSATTVTQATSVEYTTWMGALLPQSTPSIPAPWYFNQGFTDGSTGVPFPSVPANVQDDDILFLVVETANESISTPSGYVICPRSPVSSVGASPTRLMTFWKRASIPESDPTIDDSGEHTSAQILVFRGVTDTGNPWDTSDSRSGTNNTILFPPITTTDDNAAVVAAVSYLSTDGLHYVGEWNSNTLEKLAELYELNYGSNPSTPLGAACAMAIAPEAGTINDVTAALTSSQPYALWIGALKRQPNDIIRVVSSDSNIGVNNTPFILGTDGTFCHAFPRSGDLYLLFVETNNEAVSVTTPDWTEAPNSPVINSGTNPTRLSIFWTRLDGTEEIEPTILSNRELCVSQISAFRGVETSGNPFDTTSFTTGGTGTTVTIPGSTTTVDNTLIVAIADSDITTGFSDTYTSWSNADLTSVTELVDRRATNGGSLTGAVGVATGIKASAGAYGNTTATLFASSSWVGWTGALKPAGVSVPTHVASSSIMSNSSSTFSNIHSPFFPLDMQPNDLMIWTVLTTTLAPEIMAPEGWEEAPNSPIINGSTVRLNIFWKRHGARTLRPVLTGATDHSTAATAIIRNAIDTGDPFDDTSSNTGTGTSITASSVITWHPNALVICAVGTTRDTNSNFNTFSAWSNVSLDSLAILNDRMSATGTGGGVGLATGYKLGPGGTGSISVTQATSVEWVSWVGAIIPGPCVDSE